MHAVLKEPQFYYKRLINTMRHDETFLRFTHSLVHNWANVMVKTRAFYTPNQYWLIHWLALVHADTSREITEFVQQNKAESKKKTKTTNVGDDDSKEEKKKTKTTLSCLQCDGTS